MIRSQQHQRLWRPVLAIITPGSPTETLFELYSPSVLDRKSLPENNPVLIGSPTMVHRKRAPRKLQEVSATILEIIKSRSKSRIPQRRTPIVRILPRIKVQEKVTELIPRRGRIAQAAETPKMISPKSRPAESPVSRVESPSKLSRVESPSKLLRVHLPQIVVDRAPVDL
jgi:hypothetical protein